MDDRETVTIPTTPPDALLESMAMRYNHAWGLDAPPNDQIALMRTSDDWSTRIMGQQYLTTAERAAVLVTMRQLHEEVVGKGFYRYAA